MAEHSSGNHSDDMEEHRNTYNAFIKGSVALSIVCGYLLVALVSFRFAQSFNVFMGFGGLILGIVAVLLDVRRGSNWYLSVGLLVLFGLVIAASIS
jgi:Bacterial aa3 type cytochrome c oxidase subunit IV